MVGHRPQRLMPKASLEKDERGTPWSFFNELDSEFKFTLDAAASETNFKVQKFFCKENCGLTSSWDGERVWCNPPYSQTTAWVSKAHAESCLGATVVLLLPAATDTRWFHDIVLKYGHEVRFVKGRLQFDGQKDKAPFGSMVVVMRPGDGDGV